MHENETNENDSKVITEPLKEFCKHESLGAAETGKSDTEAVKRKNSK